MSKVKNILLLGAGFSRNWGGWLASEVFEYLLGCDQIDERAKKALWTHRSVGGFEAALAELQGTYRHRPDNRTEQSIENLQRATLQMFDDMNAPFQATTFSYELHYFLDTFDSIFTLNQDLLMERCYLNRRHIIATHYVPGVELVDNQDKLTAVFLSMVCSVRAKISALYKIKNRTSSCMVHAIGETIIMATFL